MIKRYGAEMTARKVRRNKSISKRQQNGKAETTRWSGRVTAESDALDLAPGVFTLADPKRIAASLKRSAEKSCRRKADPFRSAMSMLVFFINRAGRNLTDPQRRKLEKAKEELRKLFHRPAPAQD